MTISNWEEAKKRSKYHFDNDKIDPKFDAAIYLGRIQADWSAELEQAVKDAPPVSWRTRNSGDTSRPDGLAVRPESEFMAEEYDLERIGMPKDYKVTNLTYSVAPIFQRISDLFCLDKCMTRVHVQHPGQVWNLHIDKLGKWNPDNIDSVFRCFIALTDWQQGHFWNYGNYMHSGWKAGEVHTFDWQNVPHSTANAGMTPRVTLQLTGVKTDGTENFLAELARSSHVTVK